MVFNRAFIVIIISLSSFISCQQKFEVGSLSLSSINDQSQDNSSSEHYHDEAVNQDGVPKETNMGIPGAQGSISVGKDLKSPKLNTTVLKNGNVPLISPSLNQKANASSAASSFINNIESSISYLFSVNVALANYQHESGSINHSQNYLNLVKLFVEISKNPELNFDQRVMSAAFSAQRQIYYLTSIAWNYEDISGVDKYYFDFYSYLSNEFIDALINIVELDLSQNEFIKYGEYYDYLPIRVLRILSYIYSGLVSGVELPQNTNGINFYGATKRKIDVLFNNIKNQHYDTDYFYAVASGLRTVDLENKLTGESSYVKQYTGVDFNVWINNLKQSLFRNKVVSKSIRVSEVINGANAVNFYCADKDLEVYCNRYSQLMPMIEDEYLSFLGLEYFKFDYDQKVNSPDVYVFPSKRDYNLFACMMFESWCYVRFEQTAEIPTNNGGFYDATENFALTYIDLTQRTSEFTDAIMVHELAHYLQSAYLMPQDLALSSRNHYFYSAKWMTEGHAELFAVDFLYSNDSDDLYEKMLIKLGGFYKTPSTLSSLYDVVWGSLTNNQKTEFGNYSYLLAASLIKLMSEPSFKLSNDSIFNQYDLSDQNKLMNINGTGENYFLRLLVTMKNDNSFKEYYVRDTQELGNSGQAHSLLKVLRDDPNLLSVYTEKENQFEIK